MAEQSREYITLSYDPRDGSPSMMHLVHALEGILQRLEIRIEAVQDRVAALERYNQEHP